MRLNARDVRPQHLFLNQLHFQTNFLAVRRVEHETLQTSPRLERERVPLLRDGSESVDEKAEDDAAIDLLFQWSSDRRNLVECTHADLSENLVNLLKRLRGPVHCLGHIAVAAAVKYVCLAFLAMGSISRIGVDGCVCRVLAHRSQSAWLVAPNNALLHLVSRVLEKRGR